MNRRFIKRFTVFIMLFSIFMTSFNVFARNNAVSAADGAVKHKVLVMTKTTGFRHDSIDKGAKVILPQMAAQNGFQVDFTENVADFNAANLAQYDVIMFASTTGTFEQWGMTDQQKKDFMDFIKSGKGYVGVHAATDTGYDWQEYGDLTGAYFKNHPWTQKVTFNVEDPGNPATDFLGAQWKDKLEEVYYFQNNPRDKGKHILLSLDMNSVGGDLSEDHPNAWCSPEGLGRMFYTALGHHTETWSEPLFQQHLLGGLKYAWGEATNTDCDKASPKAGLQKVSITKGSFGADKQQLVGMDIAKDGTIFTISIFGKVYTVTQDGDTKEILNIPTNNEGEHGVMGIALDPNFDTNHYIYLYYTDPNKPASGKLDNHLSRYTYENGKIDPSSEQRLLLEHSDVSCCHQAGFIKFGPDGKLYLTIGDNHTPTQGPQVDSIQTSQNLDDMRGKVLRINVDGSAPSDNPFYKGDGGASDYVYAWGFRNPYRISFDTTKANGKTIIYEGDVGPDGTFNNGTKGDYDEFNAITAPGQNFGWPYGIGDKVYSKTDYPNATMVNRIDDAVFAAKFAQTKKPIAFYPYTNDATFGSGGRTAMAGPVYDYKGPNAIPGLQNKFMAYDFTRNWIKAVTTDDNGEITKINDFMSGLKAPIDMKVGPDGALYVVEFGSGWSPNAENGITKIFYGQLHRKPVVQAKASATSGKTPLTVKFDTTGTVDLDGDTLSYAWDFGDGSTSTDASPSHSYTTNGTYNVTLTVTNSAGKAALWNTTIIVGNTAPTLKITSPANGLFFTNGETVTVTAAASDAEDGQIACDKIQWSLNLLHDAHFHPYEGATGCQATFKLLDDGHGPEAKIAWNIKATVTDNGAPGTSPLTASDSITFKNKRLQAEDFDATGGNNPADRTIEGVQTEDTKDVYGGKNVGWIDSKDWIMFKNVDMSKINKMYFRMASESAPLNVEVRLDSADGQKVAAATAATTKGWQNWTTFSSPVTGVTPNAANAALPASAADSSGSVTDAVYVPQTDGAGGAVTDVVYGNSHDVYVYFPTGGQNINWVQFAAAGDAAPTEKDVCTQNCGTTPPGGGGKYDTTGALSRTNWVATASDTGNDSPGNPATDDPKTCLKCGFDGDLFSRWTTGKVMKAGMWYQADLGASTPISRVLVDFGSLWTTAQQAKHPDYFRGYKIKVSTDGTNWTTVASADTNTSYVVDKTFASVNARYVRIENTADDTTNSWWASIHELYVFPANAKSGWTFTTSPRGDGNDTNNPSDVKNVIDGKMNTRWDSGEFQKPGEWFQVNMGAVKAINEVIVDVSGHNGDYPRGYKIEVSKDGQSWKQVASKASNTDVKIDVTFDPVNAQFVRITQTGSAAANWWSIDELDIKVTDKPVVDLETVLTSDTAGRILNAGDEVKVTVSAKNAKDLYAAKLMVNYDSSKFDYVSSAINTQFGKEGETAYMLNKTEDGKLTLALTSLGEAKGHDGDVALVDITFKVNANGGATLMKESEFSSSTGELAQVTKDAAISISLSNADVDGNNKIDLGDLVAVAKAYGKTTFDKKLDINNDGKIDIQDIAFVARKLLENTGGTINALNL